MKEGDTPRMGCTHSGNRCCLLLLLLPPLPLLSLLLLLLPLLPPLLPPLLLLLLLLLLPLACGWCRVVNSSFGGSEYDGTCVV